MLYRLYCARVDFASSISFQRFVHIVFDADVINDKTFVFARIYSVDARYCLYQSMLLQWFVDIHCVEARNVESCNPHIDYDSNLEVGMWIFELNIKFLSVFISAKQIPEFFLVVFVASHYQFDTFNRHCLASILF